MRDHEHTEGNHNHQNATQSAAAGRSNVHQLHTELANRATGQQDSGVGTLHAASEHLCCTADPCTSMNLRANRSRSSAVWMPSPAQTSGAKWRPSMFCVVTCKKRARAHASEVCKQACRRQSLGERMSSTRTHGVECRQDHNNTSPPAATAIPTTFRNSSSCKPRCNCTLTS